MARLIGAEPALGPWRMIDVPPALDLRDPEAAAALVKDEAPDAVTRVTIRRDDSFLGYLTEMYGQPYIWASAGISDTSHQSGSNGNRISSRHALRASTAVAGSA